MNRISRVESVLSHQGECSSEYVSVYIYEPQSWHVQECLPRGDCILGSSVPLTAHTNSSKVSAEEFASSLPVWTSLRSDLARSPAFSVFVFECHVSFFDTLGNNHRRGCGRGASELRVTRKFISSRMGIP